MLQLELTNIKEINTFYKPIIIPAINPLDMDPSFDRNSNYNKHVRRSLLHFLGDALHWLAGSATSKDVNSTKERANQPYCHTINSTRCYSAHCIHSEHH